MAGVRRRRRPADGRLRPRHPVASGTRARGVERAERHQPVRGRRLRHDRPGLSARQVHAAFRWDASRAASTALAFGAFDFGLGRGNGFPNLVGEANAHLAVTPASLQFAVFSMGVAADYDVLVPRGRNSDTVFFPRPLARDGGTVYRAYITIDGDTARVDMDGLGSPLVYQDPRIASVKASNPFW